MALQALIPLALQMGSMVMNATKNSDNQRRLSQMRYNDLYQPQDYYMRQPDNYQDVMSGVDLATRIFGLSR